MSDICEDETPYNNKNVLITTEDVNKILKRFDIEVECENIGFYRKALVNKSYVTRKNENFVTGNENCPDDCLPLQEESNERFEFLGDSVLSTTVANYLYERYPEQQEGFLTKMRSKLVNGYMLADLCRHVGLNKWVINVIEDRVDFAELIKQNKNYKDMLIKYFQHTYLKLPKFYENDIKIVNSKKVFTIIIKNEEQIIGIGKGETKKKAEQDASEKALQYFNEL
jgi:dsRNA-specific ribonuclease